MDNWFSEPMKDEVPYKEIEQMAEDGKFHKWNFEPFDFTENGYEDLIPKLKEYTAVKYLEYQALRDGAVKVGDKSDEEKYQAEMDKMVDDVYQIYRKRNIYPTVYFSEMGIMQEIERCIAYKAFWDGDTVSCGAGIGTTLCKFLFPNLQDTPSKHDLDKKGAESIFAKFHNEEYLKRAIKFCFSYKNGCPVPTAVEGGLRLVGSAPSNFRPMNAKAVYERFTPEGGTIYDFCCVDRKTEFFNGKEWKSLADYTKGDKVLQYNEDGTAELVEPTEYIHYKSDEPFYEYTADCSWALNTCLTGNHDVVYKKHNEAGVHKMKFLDVLEASIEEDGYFEGIPVTAVLKDSEFSVHESDNVLIEAYSSIILSAPTDNRYVSKSNAGSLSEEVFTLDYNSRVRLLKLFGMHHDCKTMIVHFDNEDLVNTLKSLWNLTFNEKVVKVNLKDDEGEGILDFSTFEEIHTGYALILGERPNDDLTECAKYCFGDYYESNNTFDFVRIVDDKDKYCFVVPSHMLVLRRGSHIFVTGNCGFGGRLLGALSSKKNFKYVGTDPNTETMYHLHQLGDYIEMVTGREDSYELHCCGSEDFKGPAESVDFAFSSPPYFDLEVYSDEPTQCYNKFPKLEDWLEGYVRQTIKNIYHMLKPGACYAVNIADFTVGGGGTVAYVDEWIRLSTEEGMPLFDTVYLGVTARAGSMEQAAGELKKENILVFKKPLI